MATASLTDLMIPNTGSGVFSRCALTTTGVGFAKGQARQPALSLGEARQVSWALQVACGSLWRCSQPARCVHPSGPRFSLPAHGEVSARRGLRRRIDGDAATGVRPLSGSSTRCFTRRYKANYTGIPGHFGSVCIICCDTPYSIFSFPQVLDASSQFATCPKHRRPT